MPPWLEDAFKLISTAAKDWVKKTSSPIKYCLRRVKASIWDRRLIKTFNGRLGLAPAKVQRGDLVCILYGCSVPVIMRRKTKSNLDIELERKADELDSKEREERAVEKVKKILWKAKPSKCSSSGEQSTSSKCSRLGSVICLCPK